MSSTPAIMKNIVPFWGRISLIESPVNETELDSGVIVPTQGYDGDDGVKRGVVVDLDRLEVEGGQTSAWWDKIEPGTVVFYRGGIRLGDLVLIEISDILALEAA